MLEEVTPLTFVTAWDFLLIILAATVRLFIVLRYKAVKMYKKRQRFDIKKYFDRKHIIRWIGHYFTALVLLLVLPEIFLLILGPKYCPEFAAWSFAYDFLLGFLGYDFIKCLESFILPIVKKYYNFKK